MLRRLVLLAILFISVNSLTMTMNHGEKTCLWETGKPGDQLYASFEITKGQSQSLKVTMTDEDANIVYATIGKSHDDFSYSFDTEKKILLCFSSEKKETLDISFRYQLGNELKPINKSKREEFVTTNDVDNLSDKLQSIANEIYALQDEQRFTREKQHNYKDELNKLGRKIIISCVFETTVMLLCCLLQYFQYRSMIH